MAGGRLRKYPGDGNVTGNKPDKGLLDQNQNDVSGANDTHQTPAWTNFEFVDVTQVHGAPAPERPRGLRIRKKGSVISWLSATYRTTPRNQSGSRPKRSSDTRAFISLVEPETRVDAERRPSPRPRTGQRLGTGIPGRGSLPLEE